MSQVLPPLFIAVSALALVLALFAFWQSLRVLWQSDGPSAAVPPSAAARLALIDEKAALLKALKELAFERDLGKLSEQDYEALNARYRARAKQVLRDLDEQLGEYRGRAESLVASALNAPPPVVKTDASAAAEPEPGDGGSADESGKVKKKIKGGAAKVKTAAELEAVGGRIECGSCHTGNEPDASFCKKCGKLLEGSQS